MTNKKIFHPFIHYLIYLSCAVLYAIVIDLSLPDDGLRHLSFAANKEVMQSWGNVYPYSLFGDYDPWFGWHAFLNILLSIVDFESIHIYINVVVLFILMLLMDSLLRVYSKYNYSSFIYIIVFILVLLTSFRYVMVRPDLLSGLYVMVLLLIGNRFKLTFFLTILYIPFYYLFFIYTGSIGLVYLIQKKYKSFLGVFIGSVLGLLFHIGYDLNGYVNTVMNILNDQNLRMGLAVKEGVPIFSFLDGISYFILLPLFLIGAFFIIYKNYDYFKVNSLAIFILITSVLWVNQYRYFHLFLPMISIYILIEITNLNKRKFFYLSRKYFVIIKSYFNYSKNKKLFYLIAIPYSIIMLSYIFSSQSLNVDIEKGKYFKNGIFENKTLLSNKMDTDMFKAHYYNPTLKLIPSCSIGWFDTRNKEMKNIYIKLQSSNNIITEEELSKLIKYTKSDFYLHYFGGVQKFDFKKLELLGIIPLEIDAKKILFRIDREKNE